MSDNFLPRIRSLQKILTPSQGILLSKAADIAYFTGFVTLVPEEREAFLLITTSQVVMLHASFSPIEKFQGITYQTQPSPEGLHTTVQLLLTQGIQELLIDTRNLFVHEYQALTSFQSLTLTPLERQHIWQLRQIKDLAEQRAITAAGKLTKDAYTHALSLVLDDITERELSYEIEAYIKKNGGELAFPSIVAFGPHSSLPHHQPTATKLKKETVILIDLGAKVDHYCADMTRTTWYGSNPSAEFTTIELTVLQAYKNAFDATQNKSGSVTTADLDAAARSVISEAGYGDKFIHTTGHGLGLEIHEQPSLYKNSVTPLAVGMAITIEPGIYLENQFGYRHENTVLLLPDALVEVTA
jgi:Xaa-Pro aminopeptidase